MEKDIVNELRRIYSIYGPMSVDLRVIWWAAQEIEDLRRHIAQLEGFATSPVEKEQNP